MVLCFVDFASPAHAATAMDALQGELDLRITCSTRTENLRLVHKRCWECLLQTWIVTFYCDFLNFLGYVASSAMFDSSHSIFYGLLVVLVKVSLPPVRSHI